MGAGFSDHELESAAKAIERQLLHEMGLGTDEIDELQKRGGSRWMSDATARLPIKLARVALNAAVFARDGKL